MNIDPQPDIINTSSPETGGSRWRVVHLAAVFVLVLLSMLVFGVYHQGQMDASVTRAGIGDVLIKPDSWDQVTIYWMDGRQTMLTAPYDQKTIEELIGALASVRVTRIPVISKGNVNVLIFSRPTPYGRQVQQVYLTKRFVHQRSLARVLQDIQEKHSHSE